MKHSLLLLTLLAALHSLPAQQPAAPPKGEPTNAAEAAAQKAAAAKELDAKYQALVAKLPPDQQAWERVLQENLGSFYLPIHKNEKVAGRSNAWDFVQDDPKLPRVFRGVTPRRCARPSPAKRTFIARRRIAARPRTA
jgi:hypothetical protein